MKLFRKKEVWLPTRWGCFVLVIGTVLIVSGLVLRLSPFLALQKPVPEPELIIIKGWPEDSEMSQVLAQTGTGVGFVSTGGPVALGAELFYVWN